MNVHAFVWGEGPALRFHPNLARLAAHYATRTHNKHIPLQKHFDPEELHWLFGCFYAVAVLDGGADYRFGLCGTCWQSFYGLDPTGKKLSEVEYAVPMQERRGEFDTVVAARNPQYSSGFIVWPGGTRARYDKLIIPFADEAGRIAMLLVAAQSDTPPAVLHQYEMLGHPRIAPKAVIWSPLV